jgi:hypothetical protein
MKLWELMRDYQNHEFMKPIWAGIDTTVWPWRLLGITFQNMFDIDELVDYILVEGRYGIGMSEVFWFKMPLPVDPVEPVAMQNTFLREFDLAWRRWRQEPEPHIVLGEN